MTTDKPLSAEELKYDVFSYDGPMKQCISGFVRNALEIEPPLTVDQRDSLEWSLNEMARWCRHFLSEIDRLNAERDSVRDAALEEAAVKCLATADEGLGPHYFAEIIRSLKSQPKENTNGKD